MSTDLLKNKINNAPKGIGVYLMRDKSGRVIYVGKAKNLRSRIRAYFGMKDSRPMIPFLVPKICDVEFIMTDTEKEALILENNLIKEHRPRYNVYFRDDKDYFNLRIDQREPFPQFQLIRRPKKDGATYFGPFSSSTAVKETLHFIQRIFPMRTCKMVEFQTRSRPCIEYEIGRCLAPCCNLVDAETYHEMVRDAVSFMEGRGSKLKADLRKRMKTAAEKFRFEEAARIRDMLRAIEQTLEKQKIMSMSSRDQDVFGLHREKDLTQACVIFIRKGRIMGSKRLPLIRAGAGSSEILSSLLKRYYNDEFLIPDEVLIPEKIEDRGVIAEWLTDKKGASVSVEIPQKGKKKALVEMARQNAENLFRTERASEQDHTSEIESLADLLRLKKVPRRIECFDISNVGGRHAVGSLAAFTGGMPDKSRYKRFRIRSVAGMDDYGMMYEVMKRRYSGREDLPDLILVDGGKGQLNVALTVLDELGIGDVDVIGLAKEAREAVPSVCGPGRKSSGILKKEDRVYLAGRKDPVYLSKHPAALHLLQRIRDEAHRFAISYYRKLKQKNDFRSILDDIPGIGEIRKKALLMHFQDAQKMRGASVEELKEVPGIGGVAAEQIRKYFDENPDIPEE
ncbi:MAG: excinuclease ABC subunit UvrC [Syntrophales bacterium]